jgi:hypothetical protein
VGGGGLVPLNEPEECDWDACDEEA